MFATALAGGDTYADFHAMVLKKILDYHDFKALAFLIKIIVFRTCCF
jgi:hypothetical protein